MISYWLCVFTTIYLDVQFVAFILFSLASAKKKKVNICLPVCLGKFSSAIFFVEKLEGNSGEKKGGKDRKHELAFADLLR